MRVQFKQDPKERERYVAEPNYAQHKAELSNQRRNNVSIVSMKGIIICTFLAVAVVLLIVFLISFNSK